MNSCLESVDRIIDESASDVRMHLPAEAFFAVEAIDYTDPASMRWAAAMLAMLAEDTPEYLREPAF